MKGKNMQKKLKLMAAASSLLLSTCLCTGRASVAEAVGNYTFYNNINYLYEGNADWYDDEDNDDGYDNSKGNWHDNPDGGSSWWNKGEDLPHKPFTTEVPEGYTPIRNIDELQGNAKCKLFI